MYLKNVPDRTAALSKVAGWSTLGGLLVFSYLFLAVFVDINNFPGGAISFSLGGSITTQFNSTVTVYLVSTLALTLLCIYISIMLPESFPIAKRVELLRQRITRPESQSWIENMTSSLAVVFEPLKLLKPTYDPSKGRWNKRLVFCAIHIFIVTVADGYAVISMILYFTTYHKYTPAKVCGYFIISH